MKLVNQSSLPTVLAGLLVRASSPWRATLTVSYRTTLFGTNKWHCLPHTQTLPFLAIILLILSHFFSFLFFPTCERFIGREREREEGGEGKRSHFFRTKLLAHFVDSISSIDKESFMLVTGLLATIYSFINR